MSCGRTIAVGDFVGGSIDRKRPVRQCDSDSPERIGRTRTRRVTDADIRNRGAPVLVPMELARIMISDVSDQQVIYLREVEGERMLPILIGPFEAASIERRVKKDYPQRPLTHDLLKSTIEALGGEFESIVINDLRDHTYFAKLYIRQHGNLLEIDSRPSDAVALAVHYEPHLPIYVDSSVLDQVP